jgi:hypothetical protein
MGHEVLCKVLRAISAFLRKNGHFQNSTGQRVRDFMAALAMDRGE